MLVNLVGSSGFKMYSLNSNTEILKGMEVSFYISKGEKKDSYFTCLHSECA